MRITKLQEGNIVAVRDNTRVVKPVIPELIKAKPRQDQLIDLGGEPSTDTRTAAERNRDYWHPFKGAKERFKSSMRNGTNPLVGLERTVMPAMAGAALVTTPATVIGGMLGGEAVNKATGGWGDWLESKTGLPSELGEYTNPGAIYGGIKGYKVGRLSKDFVFGNADLGWSPLVNRRYFKRYSKIPIEEGHYYRVTSDNEIAAINRSGKLQAPDRSYYDPQTAKIIAERLKLSLDEVLELDSKNSQLLDQMFNEAPKPKGTLGLRPRRKSNHGDVAFQKEGLFYDSNNPKSPYYGSPTIKGSQAKSKFQEGHHGKYTDNFNENININEAPHYGAAARQQVISGAKNIGKDLGQDAVVNTTQEVVSKRKGGSLVSDGRRFKFKDSTLVKNSKTLNNKRDMRKKFMKSDRPTYTNNRVKKNQSGGVLSVDPSIFVSWNNISTSNIKLPEVDYTPKSNLDRFLERTENSVSINLLGNPKEQEEKQDQKEIPVSKEEPIVKKTPLANPSKGNDAFNKIYDELISEMPDAAEYRDFLTTVAKYESGFDSRAKNKYAPAWGYFQFMQDDNKYNNIKSYAGVDTQTFLNNPKLQIRAAINLAKAMEKGFTKEDIEAAKSKGISRWGMLGGAWLGGNGGLRKYLLQNINSSDKHWNPEGKGIDMENQIRRYNF